MPRILLLATTTGYQTRMFGEAAARLGVELVFATDRCHQLDDPWRDAAIPVRFYDEARSLVRIVESAAPPNQIDGVLALGDRATVLAACAAAALGLPGHSADAARRASNKLLTRCAFRDAGLPVPWHVGVPLNAEADRVLEQVTTFPCVVKPLALSASRGVMRADSPNDFRVAYGRLQRLLQQVEIRARRDPANDLILIEEYIDGPEYAVEAALHRGALHLFALFDKPDPLEGPFFEETIYVTPSVLPPATQERTVRAVADAARALGLWHGPIHAECRLNDDRVVVLEVAARPIGGLCTRALRFKGPGGDTLTFEEVLLRNALGESPQAFTREPAASALMMIPIPRRGVYKRVDGLEEALAVHGVDEIRITAKPDERLVPLPEGASYLGFIFARAESAPAAVNSVREAHRHLAFRIERAVGII